MKTILLISCILGIAIPEISNGQINFKHISFDNAKAEAAIQHKLIFIVVKDSACEKCNENAMKIFADTAMDNKINKYCIPVLYEKNEYADESLLKNKFSIIGYQVLLFNKNGLLLGRLLGTIALRHYYLARIDSALAQDNRNADNYETMQQAFAMDTSNYVLLQNLIKLRGDVGMNNDTFMDKLVKIVPADSLMSLSFLQYLSKSCPILSSDTYKALHKNQEQFDEAWFRMSSSERSKINSIIIAKSLRKAIAEKDAGLAHSTANFAYKINYNGFLGSDAYFFTITDYYKAVSDTILYLFTAKHYSDNILMHINVDSVKQLDSLRFEKIKLLDEYKNLPEDSIKIVHDLFMIQSAKSASYSSKLNNIAWQVYLYSADAYDILIYSGGAKKEV